VQDGGRWGPEYFVVLEGEDRCADSFCVEGFEARAVVLLRTSVVDEEEGDVVLESELENLLYGARPRGGGDYLVRWMVGA